MTKEDIIRLAVEAELVSDWDGGCTSAWVEGHDLTPYLERFAALVVAAEREACAKVVENYALGYAEPVWAFKLTAAIRARGQE